MHHPATPPGRPPTAPGGPASAPARALGPGPVPVGAQAVSGPRPIGAPGTALTAAHLYKVQAVTPDNSPSPCPRCGLPFPDAAPEHLAACQCGTFWGPLSPTPPTGEAWDGLLDQLKTRSGDRQPRCEARVPGVCLGGESGSLAAVPRDRVSMHHRQPRGKGGTARYDQWVPEVGRWVEQLPSLADVVLACGTGVVGCHAWIEANRALALILGWLVPMPVPGRPRVAGTDPAQVVLTLPDKRRVLLDPYAPVYLPAPDGMRWAA